MGIYGTTPSNTAAVAITNRNYADVRYTDFSLSGHIL